MKTLPIAPGKLFAMVLLLGAVACPVYAQTASPAFSTQAAMVDTANGVFTVDLPLENLGASAESVTVTTATLGGVPAIYGTPSSLGNIDSAMPGEVDVQFDEAALIPGHRYLLTVRGTYLSGGTTLGFAVNRFVLYPGPGLTLAERQAVLQQVQTEYQQLLATPGVSFGPAMASYLQTLPQFSSSGSSDAYTAWGVFSDGRTLIITDNFVPTLGTAPAAAAVRAGVVVRAEASRAALLAARPTATGPVPAVPLLPTNPLAIVLNGFGPLYTNTVNLSNAVAGYLRQGGYNTVVIHGATLSDLRTRVQNIGALLITTHSGTGSFPKQYSLWTADVVPMSPLVKQEDPVIAADIAAGRVNVFLASVGTVNGQTASETHYAFTPLFVSRYMTFAHGALFFNNACYGATGLPSANAFSQSVISAGAAVYVGWTERSRDDAATAIQYFFDRVLGTNAFNPETPAQRPFSVEPVMGWMHRLGYDVVPITGAVLSTSPTSTDMILAPSIERLSLTELDQVAGPTQSPLMTLTGSFGDTPGTVMVGGMPCPVTSWSTIQIVCQIARSGPGSSGDVQVSLNTLKSNIVRLTSWTGGLSYLISGQGTLGASLTGSLHFRADIHSYRQSPGTTPLTPIGGSPLLADSTAGWQAVGTASSTDPATGFTTTQSLAGSGTLSPFPAVTSDSITNLNGQLQVNPTSRTASLELTATSGPPNGGVNVTVSSNGNPPFTSTQVWGLDSPAILPLSLDGNYNINSGSTSGVTQDSLYIVPLTNAATNTTPTPWTLKWSAFGVSSAPDPTAGQ